MMGRQPKVQKKMFYTKFNLDRRIRKDHILRKIDEHINFEFIYDQVKDTYGSKGNVSVPPPVILKMMLLLILYNVRSERELMNTIPERLDWLWFLGYDLDDQIPDHSVLSKARARWGVDAFKAFFERIVWQCVDAGLVDGSKLFMDGCLIQADASNNSVVNKESLRRYLNKSYQTLETRLEEPQADTDDDDDPRPGAANQKHISTTDPDAAVSVHHCDFPITDAAKIDAGLERDMATVRRVVNLGRALRKHHDLRVRQPLADVTVFTRDPRIRAAVESHTALIGEELNVKTVLVDDEESHVVELTAKANFKALGPRLGPKTKQVAAAVAELDHDDVDRLLAGASVVVAGETG